MPAKECLQVSNLSSSFCWFLFPAITYTEATQGAKRFGVQKCGRDRVGGTD